MLLFLIFFLLSVVFSVFLLCKFLLNFFRGLFFYWVYLGNYYMFEENKVMKNIIVLAFFCIMFTACDSANNQHPSAQYEEKKTDLKEIERNSPLKFLKING